jgi:hypothetical protein
MFSYAVYGLHIHSDLPLHGLMLSEGRTGVDVFIRLGRVNRPLSKAKPREGCFYATSDEAYFFWEGEGMFLVQGGREIIVEPSPGVEERVLRLTLLGIALGVLLHQRGLLTLHASAVVINGGAVAFLGRKGQGKSTMAAALYARNYGVLADDIVACTINDPGRPMVLPGFPQLKLWPEVAAFFGDTPDTLPRLHPQSEKRARPAGRAFPQAPLPLRCMYVLDEGSRRGIETLQPQEVFLELVRHSYAPRFLGTTGATASHFRWCAKLASSVPILRLRRPRVLSALPDVAQLVEEHLAHDVQQPARA